MKFEERNKTLLRQCERELEQIESRNFLLEEKIFTKLWICGDTHIHVTVKIGGLLKAHFVVRDENDRRLMHYETLHLVRDVIADEEIVTSTSKD